MLGPRTQRSLISEVVVAVLVVFSLLVHSNERYYRFFIGTSENQNLGRVRQWR
jgi:hypothetical protein